MRSWIRRQEFRPTRFWGIFFNPFYISRRLLAEAVSRFAPHVSGRVLDVGCGTKPYRDLFKTSQYVGLEVANPNVHAEASVDHTYDGETFPFLEREFDSVLSFQVLEHVRSPAGFVSEIRRVLKPGGLLLLTVPFVWEEHEIPNDRTRFTSYGLKELLSQSGFEVIRYEKINPGIQGLMQVLIAQICTPFLSRGKWIRNSAKVLIAAPLTLFSILLGFMIRGNDHFFIDSIILAKRGEM
jgi:SAM-dependent methyltransferase